MNRIILKFTAQRWTSKDWAEEVFVDDFDVTVDILNMPLHQIHEIRDHDESSDDLGREHCGHDGPCYAEVEDSLCKFFDIEYIEELTQAMLDEKRAEYAHELEQQRYRRVTIETTFIVPPENQDAVSLHSREMAQEIARAQEGDLKDHRVTRVGWHNPNEQTVEGEPA